MIEIFRTNVRKKSEARKIVSVLTAKYPLCEFNFDLEDCDKILRVKGKNMKVSSITKAVHNLSFEIKVLK